MLSTFEIEFDQPIDVERTLDAASIEYVPVDRRRAFVVCDRVVLELECGTGTLSSTERVTGSAITTRTAPSETATVVVRRIRDILAEPGRSE